jgi:hypothetical protein
MEKEVQSGVGSGTGSISQRYGSKDPEPRIRIRLWIRIKISQTPNTAFKEPRNSGINNQPLRASATTLFDIPACQAT